MPFGEEFDPIYVGFIKPVLEQAGFQVKRADDFQNQQHILKDILDGIYRRDLIVADLTSTNPNVFYELGLAHAFRKPVILLTQSIEEVPFDLQGYRLIEYSTHFAHIERGKQRLAELARAAFEGTVSFGNPVTDFIQDDISLVTSRPHISAIPDAQDDPESGGFLDHLIAITDFYNSVTEIMQGVTKDLEDMNQSLESGNQDITKVNQSKSASAPAALRQICRRLAERIKFFTDRLQAANIEYADKARDSEDSLEKVLSFSLEHGSGPEPEVEEHLSALWRLRSQAVEGRDSFLSMAQSMDELPRMERHLNREITRGSQEVRMMASNIDRTIASISRALQVYDER